MPNDNPADQLPQQARGPDHQPYANAPRHNQLPPNRGPVRRSWTRWTQHEDDSIIAAYVHWLSPVNRGAGEKQEATMYRYFRNALPETRRTAEQVSVRLRRIRQLPTFNAKVEILRRGGQQQQPGGLPEEGIGDDDGDVEAGDDEQAHGDVDPEEPEAAALDPEQRALDAVAQILQQERPQQGVRTGGANAAQMLERRHVDQRLCEEFREEYRIWKMDVDRPPLRGERKHYGTELISRSSVLLPELQRVIDEPDCSVTTLNAALYSAAKVLLKEANPTGGRPDQAEGNVPRTNGGLLRLEQGLQRLRRELGWICQLQRTPQAEWSTRLRNRTAKLRRRYGSSENALHNLKTVKTLELEHVSERIRTIKHRRRQREFKHQMARDRALFYRLRSQEHEGEDQEGHNGEDRNREGPTAEELKTFWSEVWRAPTVEDDARAIEEDGEWHEDFLEALESEERMDSITITPEMVASTIRGAKTWKAPGPDGVRMVWLKLYCDLIAPALARCYQRILNNPETSPAWFTTARCHLTPKKVPEGQQRLPRHYRPISCLPTTYKVFTRVIYDSLYTHCEKSALIMPREQQGGRSHSMGCLHQLWLDSLATHHIRQARHRCAIAWVDLERAYDGLLPAWVDYWMAKYKLAPNFRSWLTTTRQNWRVQLQRGGETVAQAVPVRRGLLQGDALSVLVFILATSPLTAALKHAHGAYCFGRPRPGGPEISHLAIIDDYKIYCRGARELGEKLKILSRVSNKAGLGVSKPKCAWLSVRNGVPEARNDALLNAPPELQDVPYLENDATYKYLGIEQALVPGPETYRRIKEELRTRVKRILKLELPAVKTINALNEWALPIAQYACGAGVISRSQAAELDVMVRNTFRRSKCLSHSSSTSLFHMRRKDGGRGVRSIEDMWTRTVISGVEYRRQRFSDILDILPATSPLKKIETAANRATADLLLDTTQPITGDMLRNACADRWKKLLEDQPQAGRWWRELALAAPEGIDMDATLGWIDDANTTLGMHVENVIMNIRASCIPTRSFPRRQRDPTCRICGRTDESVTHILTSCVALQHAEYTHRHNAVCKVIYSNALALLGFKMHEEYWTWTRPPSFTSGDQRVLWDQQIPTPRKLEHSRPDLLIRNKKRIVICEVAVTSDANIVNKERDKRLRYQPLLRELQQLHPDCTIQLLVVVIGTTGGVTKQLRRGIEEAGLDCNIVTEMQRAAATHSAHLLLRVLYSRKLLNIE